MSVAFQAAMKKFSLHLTGHSAISALTTVLPCRASNSFSVSGGGLRISMEMVAGYRYAQVFAPPGKDYVALEPMTAPTNAVASGRGLQFVQPGDQYRAAFRIDCASASH